MKFEDEITKTHVLCQYYNGLVIAFNSIEAHKRLMHFNSVAFGCIC